MSRYAIYTRQSDNIDTAFASCQVPFDACHSFLEAHKDYGREHVPIDGRELASPVEPRVFVRCEPHARSETTSAAAGPGMAWGEVVLECHTPSS